MFLNLNDSKWIETDNILTFEPYCDFLNVKIASDGLLTGGRGSEYRMGLIINGVKLELYSNKNTNVCDPQTAINICGTMFYADRERLWNNYYDILEIKTGKSYKNKKIEIWTHKGARGKRRHFKCLETNQYFNRKSDAISFLHAATNGLYQISVLEEQLIKTLNNEISSCFGFHFKEVL